MIKVGSRLKNEYVVKYILIEETQKPNKVQHNLALFKNNAQVRRSEFS